MQPPSSSRRHAAPETAARRPAGRWWRRCSAALFIVVALLAVAFASQPWWLAPLVARSLAASSARPVRIGSLWLGLGDGLRPVLHFRDVDIGNAPWAAHDRPFAVAASGAAVIAWRSFAERRPVVDRLILHDARIDMERLADGRRNWRLIDPDNRGPGRYRILALEADRSSLHLVHRGIGLELEVSSAPHRPAAMAAAGAADADAANPELTAHLTLSGRWRGLPFSADVDTGAELTFRETGRSTRFRGEGLAGGARLRADGRAGDIFLAPVVDARIDLAGDKLGPLRAVFGGRPGDAAPLRPYRLSGRFTAARQDYALQEAAANVGSTDLAGSLGIVRGEPRSRVSARLQSRSASLADLTWLAGVDVPAVRNAPLPVARETAVAVAQAASAVARAALAAASAPETAAHPDAPFSSARHIDADVAFEARRFDAPAWPAVESLRFAGSLEDGRISLSQFDVGIGHGHATGQFGMDVRSDPAPARLDLAWQDVRLEALLPATAGSPRLRGAVNGQLHLSAAGASRVALLASAVGSVSATLPAGRIAGLLDAELGLQGGKILRGLISGPEQIAVRCATASADLRGGTATLKTFVLDTERTRVTGSGRIDLARATLDVTLTPQAKDPGLLDLERSIRLHGPLKRPERELVARRAPTQADCRPG